MKITKVSVVRVAVRSLPNFDLLEKWLEIILKKSSQMVVKNDDLYTMGSNPYKTHKNPTQIQANGGKC